MVAITWDAPEDRVYETGVSKGVLYPLNKEAGTYGPAKAWNGLTAVNEKPDGASPTPQYADNIKYLNLLSAETFAATIEALTYPDEFALCDGTAEPQPGVQVGQQDRLAFGLCYRTELGNADDPAAGYKLHLIYGALAAPSEKDHATINDTPAPVAFSWDLSTTPVAVTGLKPTATLTIDSTVVDSDALTTLETALYNTTGTMPLPDAVIAMFAPDES